MEIKPFTALDVGNLHLQPVFLHSILKIVFLLLNSVHILTENQGEGRTGQLTSVWDGNVSQWVDSEYC